MGYQTGQVGARRPDVPIVIDFHVHAIDPYVYEKTKGKTVLTAFGAKPEPARPAGSGTGREKYMQPELQIEDMEKRGIDRHVICSPLVSIGTSWADPESDRDMCMRMNDTAADWVRRYPDRFIGSFTLPMQNMDYTLAEIERSVDQLGHRLIVVSSEVKGRYLGHPELRPFWQAVNDRDLTVFLHPEGVKDLWYQDYMLWNSVGQPLEETKAMCSMIYEGLFEQFPNLKIVVSHGGGYLPHYTGRLDRNVRTAPQTTKNITRKPSDYLRNFYYDTCVYDPQILAALIRRVGADRMVLGSDYPTGEVDPVGFVDASGMVSSAELAMISAGTAAKLLGIELPAAAVSA